MLNGNRHDIQISTYIQRLASCTLVVPDFSFSVRLFVDDRGRTLRAAGLVPSLVLRQQTNPGCPSKFPLGCLTGFFGYRRHGRGDCKVRLTDRRSVSV
jgi:hypothetical protein